MGDSVSISCDKCKHDALEKETSSGKKKPKTLEEFKSSFRNNVMIGRGMNKGDILLPDILLPGYCNTCHKILGTTAEDPYCNKCKSLLSLCGSFQLKHEKEYCDTHNFFYSLDFLEDNPWGLTIENIIEESKLTQSQKAYFKQHPDKLDEYELKFTLDYSKRFYCPKCKTENLHISMGFMMWD